MTNQNDLLPDESFKDVNLLTSAVNAKISNSIARSCHPIGVSVSGHLIDVYEKMRSHSGEVIVQAHYQMRTQEYLHSLFWYINKFQISVIPKQVQMCYGPNERFKDFNHAYLPQKTIELNNPSRWGPICVSSRFDLYPHESIHYDIPKESTSKVMQNERKVILFGSEVYDLVMKVVCQHAGRLLDIYDFLREFETSIPPNFISFMGEAVKSSMASHEEELIKEVAWLNKFLPDISWRLEFMERARGVLPKPTDDSIFDLKHNLVNTLKSLRKKYPRLRREKK